MDPRQLFIEDPHSDRIRLTRAGIERYGPRFAREGIDARQIVTRAQLEAATDASFMHELHELASETEGSNPDLDRIFDDLLKPDRSG